MDLEIHVVPEKRNENVVMIFKKLSEIVNYQISDKEIKAKRCQNKCIFKPTF